MFFHNLLDQRQTDTGAVFEVIRLQGLKHLKDFIVIFRGYSLAIIAHGELIVFSIIFTRYTDPSLISTMVLQAVTDQVREHLSEL